MKKIMFNDKYGLTQAVLEGRKTMTRRLVQSNNIVEITTSDGVNHHVDGTCGSYHEYKDKDGKAWLAWSPYKVGEVVAIAQSYKEIGLTFAPYQDMTFQKKHVAQWGNTRSMKGWNNKMYVRADLMPHHIRITEIKVERLQDISDEDCIKEGVFLDVTAPKCYQPFYTFVNSKTKDNTPIGFENPRYAFHVLIDKISGKGTWERNPLAFAYSFEKID